MNRPISTQSTSTRTSSSRPTWDRRETAAAIDALRERVSALERKYLAGDDARSPA